MEPIRDELVLGDVPRRTRRRAPMPTERLRFNFLADARALRRLSDDARWDVAYAAETTHLAPRSCQAIDGSGRVSLIEEGSALVLTDTPADGAWTDVDGIMWDADGERISIDTVTGMRVIGRLEPGELFGDTELQPAEWRGATIRSGVQGLRLMTWDSIELHRVLATAVLRFDELREEYAARTGADPRQLGLFNDLPMHLMRGVVNDARRERFTPGEAIVTQGEEGDRFYVLLAGRAVVVRDGDAVATLARGDYFGELALLGHAPRAATVRAVEVLECWSIGAEAFALVLRHRLLDAVDPLERDVAAGQGAALPSGSSLAARLRGMR